MSDLFVIVLLVSSISCKNVNKEAVEKQDKKIVKSEVNVISLNKVDTINDCNLSDSICNMVKAILNESGRVSEFEYSNLLKRNLINECKFPRNSPEQYLLLDLVKYLSINSTSNDNVLMLLSLRMYFPRNVEFIERFQRVIPEVALKNTEVFLFELNKMAKLEQKKILGNIEFIKTKEDVIKLYNNLNAIKSEELLGIKNIALEIINSEFGSILN